ncbi:ABC-three component system protein [Paenibacillus sp. FSL M7-0896]|uniref:ABC-three component system protein n=1 Tax=Paenibacillus sp. FSL M7-0896 TaxID=2921610 RepID=UPI0030DC8050
MKTAYHDAMNSWNGYSHQGKVALYATLSMINELNLNKATSAEYELELEYLEDFTILHDELPIQIHQVKTYNSAAPSEYKDAVWTLLGKSLMFESIKQCYLHTSEKLPLKAKLKEAYASAVAPSTSKSEILYSPHDYYTYVNDRNGYDEAFNKFDLYLYNSDSFCSLNGIKPLVLNQIRLYYSNRGISRSSEHVDRAYYVLLATVDQHITIRHESLQFDSTTVERKLPFSFFINLLEQNYEEPSKSYYISHLKELFYSSCEQFMYKLQQQHSESDAYKRINKFSKVITQMDDLSFLRLCKKWSPNVHASELNLSTFHGLIPTQGLSDPFLKSLFVFSEPLQEDKFMFMKKNSLQQNISYLPTTLHDRPTTIYDDNEIDEHEMGRIASLIIQNSDIDDLHEVDVMISSYLSMESLEKTASRYTKDIPEIEDSNEDIHKHEKFMRIKQIRMIPFNIAREELK